MKTATSLLLALSLALNATLAFFIFRPAIGGTDAPRVAPVRAKSAPESPALTSETWGKLQPDDPRTLVEQLRAAGFPPDQVRAILLAHLFDANSARRKALAAASDNLPFWKDGVRDPKAQAALRQFDREQQKLVREILGPDADSDDPMARLNQNRNLDFLPKEKADEVRQLLREFEERRADLFAGGFNYLVDREKMTALEKDQRDAIARALSPAEMLEYDLRTSNTANSLRTELTAFRPTEEEFRTIYQLRAPFDQRFNTGLGGINFDQEQQRQRSDAQRLLNEQIKTALGPARASEYERMTNYNYRQTSQLVTRLDMPPETTDRLYAVQKEFEQRRNDMYRGGISSREEMVEKMTALQQEALARVTPILRTASAVEAYKQYGGTWINGMIPRSPVRAPETRPPAPK